MPKDPSLIDYGFNIDLESEMIQKDTQEEPKKGGLSNQIRHRSRSRDLEEAKNDPKHAQKHR